MKANQPFDGLIQSLYSEPEENAIDLAYAHFGALASIGDTEACGSTLTALDVSRLTPAVIASILTATAPIKRFIPDRDGFYSRSKRYLDTIRSEADNARLLVGLD